MKKNLLYGNIASIANCLPVGIDIKLGILAGLNTCTADELDAIGKNFSLVRVTTYWLPESNTVFSSRITDFVAEQVMDFRAKQHGGMYVSGDSCVPDWDSRASCNHKWKKYVGIMDSFEYCEHCDEKRR